MNSGSGSCGIRDYAANATRYETPRESLQSVLVSHPPWLARRGWSQASRSDDRVQFRAENAHISRSERWFYDNPETDTAQTRRWSTPVRSD